MHRFIAIILGGILTCSITFAQKVRVDYDHGANFAKYHTYSWGQTQAAPEVSQLVEQRIVAQIEENLARRGLKRVETGGDLLVTSRLPSNKKWSTLPSATDGWGYWGYGYYGGGGISTTTETQIPIGTIVVDLLDPKPSSWSFAEPPPTP